MKSENEILNIQVSELQKAVLQLQQSATEIKWLDSSDVKKTFHISESTLSRYRKNNEIPYTLLGKKYLYPEIFFTKSLMKKVVNAHLL